MVRIHKALVFAPSQSAIAFSSEVDTGSREENALKTKIRINQGSFPMSISAITTSAHIATLYSGDGHR